MNTKIFDILPGNGGTKELFESLYIVASMLLMSGGLYLLFSPDSSLGDMARSEGFGRYTQLLNFPAYLYGIVFFIRRPTEIFRAISSASLIYFLVCLCFISSFWSIEPGVTFIRSLLLLMTCLFASAVFMRYSYFDLLRLSMFLFVLLIIVTFMSVVLSGGVSVHQDQHYPAVRGFFNHKNVTGRYFCLGLVVILAFIYARKFNNKLLSDKSIFVILFGLGSIILMTRSTTSMLLFTILIATYFFVKNVGRNFRYFFVLVVLFLIAFSYFYAYFDEIFNIVVDSTGKDLTLTGRTYIWEFLMFEVTQYRPWLGFGYSAFWGSESGALTSDFGLGEYIPPHAHNGLLQVYTDLGGVGLIVFIAILFSFFIRSFVTSFVRNNQVGPILFFVFYIFINISETSVLAYGSLIWFFFVLFYSQSSSSTHVKRKGI